MFWKKTKAEVKMGFISDQKGIMSRYIREENAWKEHLNKTRSFIVESAKNRQNKWIAILGSGWLLDVPYQEISELFEKVYLVDISHPRQVVNKVKKLKNIELITFDITGGVIDNVYDSIKNKNIDLKILAEITPDFSFENKTKGFVVSVNLLNQLDNLICDYLKKLNRFSETEIKKFRKEIQKRHIEALEKQDACLITDYEEKIYSSEMILKATKPLIFTTLPKGKKRNYWNWNFDMQMTFNAKHKTIFKVVAIDI